MTPKNVVTLMAVSSYFRAPFASKGLHGSETLLEPALKQFNPNFPLIKDKLSRKISTFVRFEILGVLGNTLAADHMYSRHRLEKLPEQVQTVLSQERRTFR